MGEGVLEDGEVSFAVVDILKTSLLPIADHLNLGMKKGRDGEKALSKIL
ncbi:MAG: hypothetical protein WBD09_10955 [Halobacteriota archaeon]